SLYAASPAPQAASNGKRPSTLSCGSFAFADSTAATARSTSGPAPEEPVEYDTLATRGSMPNCFAVRAETTAISPSCSAAGFGLTAQSPKAHSRPRMTIKKIDETTDASGTVLMI